MPPRSSTRLASRRGNASGPAWLVVVPAAVLCALLIGLGVVSLLRQHAHGRVALWVLVLAAAPLAGSLLVASLRRWRAATTATPLPPSSFSSNAPLSPSAAASITFTDLDELVPTEARSIERDESTSRRVGPTAAPQDASTCDRVTNWSSDLG